MWLDTVLVWTIIKFLFLLLILYNIFKLEMALVEVTNIIFENELALF